MNDTNDAMVNKWFGLALMWATFLFFISMASVVIFFFIGTLLDLISVNTFEILQRIPEGGAYFAIIKASFASVIAFMVVVMLRYTSGPIEYEAAGLKFKGASGPVVLWVLCFLALCAGIAVLT